MEDIKKEFEILKNNLIKTSEEYGKALQAFSDGLPNDTRQSVMIKRDLHSEKLDLWLENLEKYKSTVSTNFYSASCQRKIIVDLQNRIKQLTEVKPEDGKMNLYKVTLKYGYDYSKDFKFLVIAGGIEKAETMAKDTFRGYGYGSFRFHIIELLASEGQYANPDILLLEKE